MISSIFSSIVSASKFMLSGIVFIFLLKSEAVIEKVPSNYFFIFKSAEKKKILKLLISNP